ncbi:MAG: hypothetical protein ACW98X_07435 [Promethearchaeota archaeon]|jgi:hypothetical protein
MSFSIEGSDTSKKSSEKKKISSQSSEDRNSQDHLEKVEDVFDENLTTLKKVHAILLNCINLTQKQKLEFAESERFFMKLHLKKLIDKLKR